MRLNLDAVIEELQSSRSFIYHPTNFPGAICLAEPGSGNPPVVVTIPFGMGDDIPEAVMRKIMERTSIDFEEFK